MNHVERFRAIMDFQPVDRLPRWEWAMWWDQTIANEFIAPYYRRIVPRLARMGTIPLVDTDGDVSLLVPWLEREGIRGALPLERQAGGFIPSVDHQTPPHVTLAEYRGYLRLLDEYTAAGAGIP
jgi:hypothetical protein